MHSKRCSLALGGKKSLAAWPKYGPLTDSVSLYELLREAAALCLLHHQIGQSVLPGQEDKSSLQSSLLTHSGLLRVEFLRNRTVKRRNNSSAQPVFTTIHFNVLLGFLQIWPFCTKSATTMSAIPGILLQMIVLLLLLLTVLHYTCVCVCVCVCVFAWLQAKE